jgi:membrane fusion protein (multidrug efflux system)
MRSVLLSRYSVSVARVLKRLTIVLLLGLAVPVFGLAVPVRAQQPASGVIPVGTVQAERKLIVHTIDFVGRVNAVNKVEVRARVTGYLEEVLFKEGDFVKEGQPLYH